MTTLADTRPRTLMGGLSRVWRAARSGLLFSLFGVGAVLAAGVYIPLVQLLDRSQSRDLRTQRVIQRLFSVFVWLGTALRIWRVDHSGIERVREPGCLILANHPTLMDVVFLLSFLPQADCVVKQQAWQNPALSGIVRAAGYIPNSGGAELVEACAERLRQGRTVVLFPEGSRSPVHGLGRIQRGAAHVALQSGCGIIPVVIDCQPPALKKGEAWYAIPDELLKFRLSFGATVYAREVVDMEARPAVSARQLSTWLKNYLEAGLQSERA